MTIDPTPGGAVLAPLFFSVLRLIHLTFPARIDKDVSKLHRKTKLLCSHLLIISVCLFFSSSIVILYLWECNVSLYCQTFMVYSGNQR